MQEDLGSTCLVCAKTGQAPGSDSWPPATVLGENVAKVEINEGPFKQKVKNIHSPSFLVVGSR